MKVRSINNPNEMITWDVKESSFPMKSENACRSKRQYLVGQILKRRFRLDPILEDVTIAGTRLSLDFYIPQRQIAVEVQGEQHNEFNAFFHENMSDFNEQKQRDALKAMFCEMNNISLLVFETAKEAEDYFKL